LHRFRLYEPGASSSILRLLPFVRPYWLRAVEAGLCTAFSTAMALPMPLLSIYVIDHVIGQDQLTALDVVCAALGLAIVMGLGLGYLQRYLLLVFTRRVFFDLELKLFRTVHTLPVDYFQRHSPGYIATRISGDVRQLSSLMAGAYIGGLSNLTLMLAGLAVMLAIHPTLTLAVAAVLPGFAWINLHFGRRVQAQTDEVQQFKGVSNAIRLESLHSAATVRAFDRGKLEAIRLAGRLHDEVGARLRRDCGLVMAQALQMFLFSVGGLFLLWYGARAIIADDLTLGQFVAFNTLLAYVYGPMGQLAAIYVGFRQGLGVLRRVLEILDTPPESRHGADVPRTSTPIVLERVAYGYDPLFPILRDVSCQLMPGQITAILGPSGSGKTTLVKLLLRFSQAHSGRILAHGRDILAFDLKAWRALIGYVEQDVRLFPGTIRDNIAYGNCVATTTEIETAAETMNCMEFVARFPDGLGTRIGSGGVQLSGGQKQRIALARAILRDPVLLILDEAIASLDPLAEIPVLEALRDAPADRTTLLISHQLPSISIADRVLALDGGRIVEDGSVEELSVSGGYLDGYHSVNRRASTL
jgi:ABC-type bacteriocin/lantibiotic exporter with double-glycine peptidase domain